MSLPIPRYSHQFAVEFKTVENILKEQCDALSLSLLRVSAMSMLGGELTFAFTDDVDNEVFNALTTFVDSTDHKIIIHYVDPTTGEPNRSLALIDLEIVNWCFVEMERGQYADKVKVLEARLIVKYSAAKEVTQQ